MNVRIEHIRHSRSREDFLNRVKSNADKKKEARAKGETIQFERKGYFIFDGVVEGRWEFIRIPDGKAASLASKATLPVEKVSTGAITSEATKMYKVATVYEGMTPDVSSATKMYKVPSVYSA